jgi:hypothetical protein
MMLRLVFCRLLASVLLRAQAWQPAAYYIAFRGETVSSTALFERLVRAAPIVVDLALAVARHGVGDVSRGTLRILASLDRYPVFRFVNRLTRNLLPPRRSSFSSVTIDTCAPPAPLTQGDEVPSDLRPGFREDVISQNQLTLVTVIADGRANRVRAVMSAIDSSAKRLAPPGSLIGISTILFVRWLVISASSTWPFARPVSVRGRAASLRTERR